MKASEPTKNYFKVSHWVLQDKQWAQLSNAAKILYFTLCKLRNRYTKGSKLYFIRTEKQLVKDSGLSNYSIYKAKRELLDKRFIICNEKTRGRRTKWHIVEQEVIDHTLKI